MRAVVLSLIGLLAQFASSTALAGGPSGKAVDLFDGKTLNGWEVVGCEAEVKDGAILIKAGNGMVQTKNQYADFILEVDWKSLRQDRWDSGIYFRYEKLPKGQPWPPQYQANLAQGMEGNLVGFPAAKSKGLVTDHEWNHFKLTVQGTKASMEINGKPAWKTTGIKPPKGHIGLQAEVPGGGQFLFRNVRLTVLNCK